MSKKPTIVTLAAAILIITGATFSDRVFASTGQSLSKRGESVKHSMKDRDERRKDKKQFQGVAGIVTSINGDSITVTGKDNVVYIVDASNANIKKRGKNDDVSLEDIKSGDRLFVRGAVTGTSVVATDIMEGHPKSKRGREGASK